MSRFKHIARIQQLMSRKEQIRNIGIIAHIDHGKTTLADSLLAGAGLLSPQMAGTARVLDYLEEEQKRKITIKTANVALLYNSTEPYVINLVDTPGHVDFTGKVTRALRVIDGVVVVVDAVEEIMAQTEILTRQALEERVRPVLFINKVDRLITELQLSEEQIQKKLDHIIAAFNDLIEFYAEPQFRSQWKISPAQGNVAFGAALHGWGFTLEMAKRAGTKFSNIIASYKNRQEGALKKQLPVYQAIFEMAINAVPNPREAQSYRIEHIWDGSVESKIGKALTDCNDEAPAVVFVTNVHPESDGSVLATGRVFSGKIRKGDKLRLIETLSETEVNAVAIDMGALREDISEVSAGNLATLTLTGKVAAGETLGGGQVSAVWVEEKAEDRAAMGPADANGPQLAAKLADLLQQWVVENGLVNTGTERGCLAHAQQMAICQALAEQAESHGVLPAQRPQGLVPFDGVEGQRIHLAAWVHHKEREAGRGAQWLPDCAMAVIQQRQPGQEGAIAGLDCDGQGHSACGRQRMAQSGAGGVERRPQVGRAAAVAPGAWQVRLEGQFATVALPFRLGQEGAQSRYRLARLLRQAPTAALAQDHPGAAEAGYRAGHEAVDTVNRALKELAACAWQACARLQRWPRSWHRQELSTRCPAGPAHRRCRGV